ncbi:MAG: efflux RND transporter periplasmic adaptor subunit [Limisphaerales bacterium]
MRRPLRVIIIAAVALVLAGAACVWVWHARHGTRPLWRTSTVRRGDLRATITATGTVEPEEVVDVGAQVSGQFLEFGRDKAGKPIDYGSTVESNMLLARIDPSLFKADVDLDTAMVASDKAGEAQAAANLEQMEAKEAEAEADWKRAQKLGPSEALAPTTYDSYKATYEIAKANVNLARAAVDSAKAATVQAAATLAKAQQTLDYCTILSPVKGVIIDRRVNIGETVASGFNTPSLFLIAKDLTRIQVWASVNEADIGNIHAGQEVTFTVDAFPKRVFRGSVNKVRLNATMTQNVVTYTVEVTTDNADGRLLPYLTANVNFLAGEVTNALLVLNSALRWHPQNDLIAPEFRQAGNGASGGSSGGGRHGGEQGAGGPKGVSSQTGTLWAEAGNFVRPVPVEIGLTDGTWTEVQGEGLSEGTSVVTGIASAETAAAESAPGANPFVPQFGQRRGPTNAIPTRRSNGP